MTFNLVDIIFIAIILLIAIQASVSGFIKEFFSKVAIVVGVLMAVIFYNKLSPFLLEFIKNDFASQILSFILIFILAYLVVKLIQHFIGNLFSGEILKGLDRVLGFFFGAIEGLLIVCIILILFYAQPWFSTDAMLQDSFFHRALHEILATPVIAVQGFISLGSRYFSLV